MSLDEAPRRRVVDNSNGQARQAIAATLEQFAAWRRDLAHFDAQVDRHFSAADRERMLARCAQIEGELLAARTDLLAGLMDAPQKVTAHSRVVDVERALDDVERAVRALRGRLTQ
jgi:hypothetical protein